MHDTGSVKSITVSDDPRIDQAINAAAVPLDLQDNIDSKELERLKRENEIREQRKKLENSQ